VPLPRWIRNIGPWLAVFTALFLPGVPAQAQVIQRPADERPELPEFESPEESEPILPPIVQPPEPKDAPSTGPGVFVEGYRIAGSTVFSSEELASIVEPWTGRVIRSEDLVSIRNAITEHYIRNGYVNSGATLPDQDFEGGIIEIRIVEGSLSAIRVSGNKQFSARYLRDRIRRGATTPLHVGRLEERIQILQQDPRIQKIEARLAPGDRRGEAVLQIRVEETGRFGVDLRLSNREPPSIDAFGGGVDASLQNIVGWGDSFDAEFSVTDGLERYRGRYEIPFTRWDTRLSLGANYADSEITDKAFVQLGIESEFQSYQIGLIQPVYTSTQTQFDLGLIADWRRSNTKVLGTEFPFGGSGAEDDGKATASVLRFAADWLHRDQHQVFAARVQLSWGIDALDATTHSKGDRVNSAQLPDGRFVASLIQLQWARRFDSLGIQTIVRGDLQLANDPLLSLEQIAVGGYATVRGYRQNQRVEDQAAITSLEVRIPIWQDPRHIGVIELAPFVDYARVWDQSGRSSGARNPGDPKPINRKKRKAKTLSSVGIGLRWTLPRFLSAQIYWGQNINSVETSGNLQDKGVQFLVTCHFP
jgi:hemolysin activation/secretion protein